MQNLKEQLHARQTNDDSMRSKLIQVDVTKYVSSPIQVIYACALTPYLTYHAEAGEQQLFSNSVYPTELYG